jgi:hypothetical protein
MGAKPAPSSRHYAVVVLRTAVLVIVVAETIAEVRYLWRHGRRRTTSWWDRVSFEEGRRLRESELEFLAARLRPR